MTVPNGTLIQTAAATGSRKLTTTSADGKWKSYHAVPGLMQYLESDVFFARVKVRGIVKRASLKTVVFSVAKERLRDKRTDLREPEPETTVETFHDARLLYLADIENDHALAPETKRYWQYRVAALLKSWPRLDSMKLNKITLPQCRLWGRRFAKKFEAVNFNNTLAALRNILKRGGLGRDKNPAFALDRLGVKPKELTLPEPKQFEKLVEMVATSGAGQARHCADLVEFLAYSGCRISEARMVTWQDVDIERGEIKIHNAKCSKKSSAHSVRFVPIIPPMRRLLDRLRVQNQSAAIERICVLGECQKSLDRACKIVGCPRITHHDLRHLFASHCIESGVDIPTVSR
ncbi:MAG: site-specific integrase, partial [Verrucomicrobiia bacterium]